MAAFQYLQQRGHAILPQRSHHPADVAVHRLNYRAVVRLGFFTWVDKSGVAEMPVLVARRAVENVETLVENALRVLGVARKAGLANHCRAVAGPLEQGGDG